MSKIVDFNNLSPLAKIDYMNENFFFMEPILFDIFCMQKLCPNAKITTPFRSGQMKIEYNPYILKNLSIEEVEDTYKTELIRILLLHPYQRKPAPFKPEIAWQASEITIRQPQDVLGELNLLRNETFEYYYKKLLEEEDSNDNQDNQDDGKSDNEEKNSDKNEQNEKSDNSQSNSKSDNSQSDNGENSDKNDDKDGKSDNEENSDKNDDKDEQNEKPNSSGTNDTSQDDSKNENETDSEGENSDTTEKDNDNTSSSPDNSPTALWEEDDLSTEILKEKITTWLESGKGWGKTAGIFKEQVRANMKASIDYKKVLRSFRASIISSKKMLTRQKPSRRFDFLYMGSKYDFCTKLLVALDSSGSITSGALQNFLGVTQKIFKYGITELDFVFFDAALKMPIQTLKNRKTEYTVTGRGGTNFQPIFDYICENPIYDGCIIFTDGYAPEPKFTSRTKTKVVWVCIDKKAYQIHEYWMRKTGKVCYVK